MVAAANAAGAAEATATTTRWAARGAIDNEKELGVRRGKAWKAWLRMLINCCLIPSYLKVMLHLVMNALSALRTVHLGNGLRVGHVYSSLVKRTTSIWIARPGIWKEGRKQASKVQLSFSFYSWVYRANLTSEVNISTWSNHGQPKKEEEQ